MNKLNIFNITNLTKYAIREVITSLNVYSHYQHDRCMMSNGATKLK